MDIFTGGKLPTRRFQEKAAGDSFANHHFAQPAHGRFTRVNHVCLSF